MSFPYWPQSKWQYRRSVMHAPVPPRMGGYYSGFGSFGAEGTASGNAVTQGRRKCILDSFRTTAARHIRNFLSIPAVITKSVQMVTGHKPLYFINEALKKVQQELALVVDAYLRDGQQAFNKFFTAKVEPKFKMGLKEAGAPDTLVNSISFTALSGPLFKILVDTVESCTGTRPKVGPPPKLSPEMRAYLTYLKAALKAREQDQGLVDFQAMVQPGVAPPPAMVDPSKIAYTPSWAQNDGSSDAVDKAMDKGGAAIPLAIGAGLLALMFLR